MALQGHTKAYSLKDIFQFLSVNKYSGTLKIAGQGKKVHLFFVKGEIWIPLEKYSLNDPHLLVKSGIIDEETLEHCLYFQKKRGVSILGLLIYTKWVTIEELRKVLSPYLEEELYSLFLEDYEYYFYRDTFPKELDFENRNLFFIFPAGSIVMEASRRVDEVEALEEKWGKKIFRCKGIPDFASSREREIASLFKGCQKVWEIEKLFPVGKYEIFHTLKGLQEKGVLDEIASSSLENQFYTFLNQEKWVEAFWTYLQIIESNPQILSSLQPYIFGRKSSFPSEFWKGFSFFLSGKSWFPFLSNLLESPFSFCLKIKIPEQEGYGIFEIDEKSFAFGESTLSWFEKTIRLLINQGKILARDGQSFLENPLNNLQEILGKNRILAKREVIPFLEDQCLSFLGQFCFEELLELSFVPPSDSNQLTLVSCRYGFGASPSSLGKKIKAMEEDLEYLPSKEEILFLTDKGKNFPHPDPEKRNFLKPFQEGYSPFSVVYSHIEPTFTLAETIQNIATFRKEDRLRKVSVEDMRKAMEHLLHLEKWETLWELAQSAEQMGFVQQDDYCKQIYQQVKYLKTFLDEDSPRLEGELASFNLAEILQTLVGSQLSGTLRITIGEKTSSSQFKDLYFLEGDVYILREEPKGKGEAASMLIETSAFQAIDESLGSLLSNEMDMVSESEISEELARHVKEEIYEIFLWEGGRFCFIRDGLAKDFLFPHSEITKIRLKTDEFIMEAIHRLDLWAEISQIIYSEKAIFCFVTPESKRHALSSGLSPQVLYLIDGTHNIEDLVRISGQKKFEVCKIIFELYQAGYISHLPTQRVFDLAKESIERGDLKRARNYQAYLAKALPEDPRIKELNQLLEKQGGSKQM